MKKKQVIGLLAAVLIFTFVCSASILTNSLSTKIVDRQNLLNSILETTSGYELPSEEFVGVVTVDGTIMDTASTSIFTQVGYNHQKTLQYIDDLKNSYNNKGILLCVNSPGGGVYESDELYQKLMEYKETTNRPVWTYMKNQACSGGYYISMASDKIFANRNCWTGSIGVIISLGNYKEFMDKLGIKEVNITSGKNKAMGSSGETITREQKKILQSLVDESYEQFVSIIAEGRNMDIDMVKTAADGRIYTAKQALDLQLIDGIDTYEGTISDFQEYLGDSYTIYTPSETLSPFYSFLNSLGDMKAKSDAEIMTEFLKTNGNGVPMYYANPKQY